MFSFKETSTLAGRGKTLVEVRYSTRLARRIQHQGTCVDCPIDGDSLHSQAR